LGSATDVNHILVILAPEAHQPGVAIGCVETAEHAAVVALAPERLRGPTFRIARLPASRRNLAASTIAGLLRTATSPEAAFAYLVGWMILALAALIYTATRR
jgi:hypothetical protein